MPLLSAEIPEWICNGELLTDTPHSIWQQRQTRRSASTLLSAANPHVSSDGGVIDAMDVNVDGLANATELLYTFGVMRNQSVH